MNLAITTTKRSFWKAPEVREAMDVLPLHRFLERFKFKDERNDPCGRFIYVMLHYAVAKERKVSVDRVRILPKTWATRYTVEIDGGDVFRIKLDGISRSMSASGIARVLLDLVHRQPRTIFFSTDRHIEEFEQKATRFRDAQIKSFKSQFARSCRNLRLSLKIPSPDARRATRTS